MASSPKLSSLFLLTFLFIFQIHARESHFFSKIPNNNGETAQIPDKFEPLTNPEKTQDPDFIPQTRDTGYGLYGHESGQLPPSDNEEENKYRENDAVSFKTDSGEYYHNDDEENKYRGNDAVSFKTASGEYYNNDDDVNNNFQNSNSYKKPYENSFYYNKDLYDNGRQSFPNARLSRNDYTTTTTTTSYDNYNNGNGRDNANNVVRQGMSDTRFMEDGKYYYDLEKEPRHYRNSRGNVGNNNNNYYNNNNANSYEYGRYQNDEAEFQDQPDQFMP